jgi:5-hydroxyisourate hydrolase
MVMGRLTTHVLDTATGRPASGLKVVLRRCEQAAVLAEAVTNSDGRLDHPLQGSDFARGCYELSFHVGDYFRSHGAALADPAFLDVIPIRLAIADEADYHVPLLVSPYGYSTYRGS